MFKARAGEPDRDFCLDYTNIHSFAEVLADPEEGLPESKRKELAKEQTNAETERKHESGSVAHSTCGKGARPDSKTRPMRVLCLQTGCLFLVGWSGEQEIPVIFLQEKLATILRLVA